MSTSPSSEKTLSQTQPETRTTTVFEKFGATYTLHTLTRFREKWALVTRLPNGEVLDTSKDGWRQLIPRGQTPSMLWEKTGEMTEVRSLDSAHFSHELDGKGWIRVISTPDGPIMGIDVGAAEGSDEYSLLHPCVLGYVGAVVKMSPIFNVSYVLNIHKAAVRSIMPPSEPLVAIYPGFVIQNQMGLYALRGTAPVESPPLDNEGNEVTLQ